MDLENRELEDVKRVAAITILIVELIVPYLENITDLRRIKESIESGFLDRGMVYVSAKKFLGVSV
ncbi:hypothetical protein [Mesorhizobium cantuariense]|uniref:Uncharacterized protein n=1 Tax=Mesorhizobium cantuariense TaxID=1300275 RepID=A0ABV7MPW0_9HYPH